jgi:hypothetical protein
VLDSLPPQAAAIPAAPGASALEAILQNLYASGPALAGLPANVATGALQGLSAPVDTAAAAPISPLAATADDVPTEAGVAPAAGAVEGLLQPTAAATPVPTAGTSSAASIPQLNWSTLANLPSYPQLLPNGLSMPHDLICAGTGWPASTQNFGTLPVVPLFAPGRPAG